MTARLAGCPRAGRSAKLGVRKLTWLLVALVILGAVPAFAQSARKHVALAEVTNGSYYNGPDIAEDARVALLTAMMDSASLEMVGDVEVQNKVGELELQSPFTETELRKLGEAIGCDIVVSGRILACSINDYSHTANVRFRVTIFDAAAGAAVRTSMVKGKGEAREHEPATDEELIGMALTDAAYQAVLEISQNLSISATIIAAMNDDRILVSLPEGSGAQVGTELAVYRGTTEIARLVVYKVTPGHSVAKLKTNTPLHELQAGMRVLVVSTPSASLEESDVQPKKEKKNNAWKIAAAVLIGAVIVWAVVRSVRGSTAGATAGFFRTPSTDNEAIVGGEDVPVEVVISRADGTPIPDFTEVSFSLQQAVEVQSTQAVYLGTILSPVRTEGGVAATTYVPGSLGQRVRMVARVGGFTVTRDIQIGSGVATAIRLEVPEEQRVIQANGINSAQVTATVTDAAGSAVLDGTIVEFEATAGTLDVNQAATVAGVAQVLLMSPTTAGPVTITATVEGLTATTTVTIAPEEPDSVAISMANTSIAVGDSERIQVLVADRFGNPVSGATVTLVVQPASAGTITYADGNQNTEFGRILATFVAGATPMDATVTATVGNVEGEVPIVVASEDAALVQFVRFDPADRRVVADGQTFVTATVRVYSDAGASMQVADGTRITWTAPGSTIVSRQSTVREGQAECRLTSLVPGAVDVTATSGTATATAQVQFITLPAEQIQVAVQDNPISVAQDGIATTNITATVTDSNGGLVADGTTVNFTTTLGTVVGAAVTAGGTGSVTVPFSSIVTGIATVEVTSGTATPTEVTITVQPGPPAAVILSAEPRAVRADGNSFATVTAQVVDSSGNAVVDGTEVTFTALVYGVPTGAGDQTQNTTITQTARTVGGVATGILVSRNPDTGLPNNPGTARVTAQVVGVAANNAVTEVQYVSQVAASIALGANPVNVRGLDFVGNESTITALVRDSSNNPVPDNTAVYFWASKGMVRGTRGTVNGVAESYTVNGIATASLLTAGTIDDPGAAWNGWVDIKVSSGPVEEWFTNAVLFSGAASAVLEDGVTRASYIRLGGTTWDYTGNVAGGIPDIASLADGMDVVLYAIDKKGNPVADGTTVALQSDAAAIAPVGAATVGGVVNARLTTPEEAPAAPLGIGRVVTLTTTLTGPALRLEANYNVN